MMGTPRGASPARDPAHDLPTESHGPVCFERRAVSAGTGKRPTRPGDESAPPSIFQRSMDWRNKRDKKIKRLRQQAQLEGGGTTSMNFNDQYKDATVGEHLDAYHRYNMIVGEADGGTPLPEAQYRKLEKRCA